METTSLETGGDNPRKNENAAAIVKYRLVGDVQQVGFRHLVKTKAQENNLAGYAVNEKDGSLVVLLSGNQADIDKTTQVLHEGPPSARVVAVTELLPEDDLPGGEGFIIR